MKVAGPASAAVAALIISILSLQEQKATDQNQQQTALSQDAEQVSFLTNYPYTSVRVENLATTPVYDATLQITLIAAYTQDLPVNIVVGNIPACSYGTANILPILVSTMTHIMKKQVPANSFEINIMSMYFTDINGYIWQNFGGSGQLQQVPSIPYYVGWTSGVQVTYKAAGACA